MNTKESDHYLYLDELLPNILYRSPNSAELSVLGSLSNMSKDIYSKVFEVCNGNTSLLLVNGRILVLSKTIQLPNGSERKSANMFSTTNNANLTQTLPNNGIQTTRATHLEIIQAKKRNNTGVYIPIIRYEIGFRCLGADNHPEITKSNGQEVRIPDMTILKKFLVMIVN